MKWPAGVVFVSATPSQGSCAHSLGVVTCDLGSLAAGGAAFARVVVQPLVGGTLCNAAELGAVGRYDPNPADNSAAACTEVFGGRVSGLVWQDLDGDGVPDAGEPGLPNADLELRRVSDNALIATATGLGVAIVASLAYYFMQGRADKRIHELEILTNQAIALVASDGPVIKETPARRAKSAGETAKSKA